MIPVTEVRQYVQESLPEISGELPREEDLYGTLNAVREYACRKAGEHNFRSLKQCFSVAATLYEKGNGTVKSAVENVFVYSLSRLLSMVPEDRTRIKSLIPPSLRVLYVNQVQHHGY